MVKPFSLVIKGERNIIFRMRTLKNAIPLICTRENLEISIRQVLRGTERKQRTTGKYILNHKD